MADQAARDAAQGRREALGRFAYAQEWDSAAQPASLAAFRAWSERYRHAAPADRTALEAEGIELARVRRAEMRALIEREPARALALTVPAVVRQELPAAVLAELETRVAGRGELMTLETSAPDGAASQPSPSRRVVAFATSAYTAHTYGRRESFLTKEGASLHGVALDGHLAVHESPLRVLEPGEVAEALADEHCPVSKAPVSPLAAGAGVNAGAITVVQADGRVWEFCASDTMLDGFEAVLNRAEEGAGPRVVQTLAGDGSSDAPAPPSTSADAPTSHNTGNQRALVIRVDFSDFPTAPVSADAAQDMMDNQVRPYFETASFGATTLTSTVSSKLYRMPRTGSSYALAGDDSQLHVDARTAASADYTLGNFDRLIVVFPNLGTSRVSGSQITFGGQASVNGANVWLNGSFSLRLLMHELGHTYMLKHANLWQVNDGNPVSNFGSSGEYKDPFDAMGDASAADAKYHYNPWNKNRMGWIPDTQITTATTSGTYRIYRFDHKDAVASKNPLGLRIFRDGVRWYWVGLRQTFTANSSLSSGAYVVWGTNSLQQTNLLDLTTPGTNSADAALAVGQTFTDSAYGVSIKAVARGGDDPLQWIDIEVTVPSAPANVISAWGRENVFFYDGNGALVAPSPETYVPLGTKDLKQVAGGEGHMVALKTNGTVIVWGNDLQGQTGVPVGLSDVVSVAAGGNACGAVKRDGTIRVWGDTTTGQRTIPDGLVDVKQLALGTNHAFALKTDGTVVAWGNNTSGQASVPATLTDVVYIAAGNTGSVAVKRDGTVVGWGSVNFRQVPSGLSNVVAVASCGAASGGTHILALKADGTVVGWGNNLNGQVTIPTGLTNVIAIAAGGFHSAALKADGTVVAWGSTVSGATSVPPDMPRASSIATGGRSTFALQGPGVFITGQSAEAQTVASGATATFSVTASGNTGLTYQWRKDGVAIAGATGSTLSLTNVATTAAGSYDVVVSDGSMTRTTFPSRLTVTPPTTNPPGNTGPEATRISNLSIRTNAGTGAQTLIVGFVVGGPGTSGTKPLLIRGIGPTLAGFGVTGTLVDPKLELYNSASVKIQENDNWGGDTTVSTIGTQLGAFALAPSTSKDAALYTTPALASGSYSAQISGVGGTTGVALAEIYDASSGGANFTSATPRLINVSARTNSGLGADVLIAGFVVSGPAGTTKKVLIRGIGPALAAFGVTGTLVDPKLELYNSASVKIQENDNWGGTTDLATVFNSVGAFGIANSASKDAAFVAVLPPGTYTVQVSGVGNTTGVALVELYEVP
jgi:M6 family metalloprotease-like protein